MIIDNEFPISFIMGAKWKFSYLLLYKATLHVYTFPNGARKKCLIDCETDEMVAVVGRDIEVGDCCQTFFAKVLDIAPDGKWFIRLTLQRCEVR